MKRLLFLLLLIALPAEAGPRQWVKNQFERHPTRTAFVIAGAAATVHGLGLHRCRQGDVERCQAGYGAAWASFGVVTGANIVSIATAHACWKDGGGKFCNVLAYSWSAGQLGYGVHYWRNYKPEK